MLKKTQVLTPEKDNMTFGLSHAFCSKGNTLAVRTHDNKTKQDMLHIYQKKDNQFVLYDVFKPAWWKNNWQVGIKGINNSIYFTAVDVKNHIGYVMRYTDGKFITVFTVDNCENTLGMNDKSIAVDTKENYIAVTKYTIKNNPANKTILYSSEILLHCNVDNSTTVLSTQEGVEFNRVWSFRSLAIANDQLLAGSPDLEFHTNTSDTMEREYIGKHAKIDVFDLLGNHLQTITARDATPGNFYGTEIEANDNTLIVMAPAQDNKVGCAYEYKYIDGMWLQVGKHKPRDIAIHTTIKYSLYGCCLDKSGDKFILSDGLHGSIYEYSNSQLVNTHKENHSNYTWFGFDIKTDEDFTQLAVVEKDIKTDGNREGAVHIFDIFDK